MTKPSVLVLASDRSIFEIRLKPLLETLLGSGAISSFAAVDRDLSALDPAAPRRAFNIVIAQRNISLAQQRFLRRTAAPFIYDIDDLLTELPANRNRNVATSIRCIAWCLENAVAITTPNGKLAEELERSTGVPFKSRNHTVANGMDLPSVSGPEWQSPARNLLWVSSDIPLVQTETPLLAQAIAEVANELGLRATLIGRFPHDIRHAFADCVHIPWLDFQAYRKFLAASHDAIAIAPLPVFSKDHQAFVDSKSDIKVVDFLGHSIPAIYSAAFPYRSSDLSPGPLVGDDTLQWKSMLRAMAREPWRFISHNEVAAVHRMRSYREPAAILANLIDTAAGPPRPLPRPSFNGRFRAMERWLRRWRKRNQKGNS